MIIVLIELKPTFIFSVWLLHYYIKNYSLHWRKQ